MPHLIHAFVPHRDKSGISPVAPPWLLMSHLSRLVLPPCCSDPCFPSSRHDGPRTPGRGSLPSAIRCVDRGGSALRSPRIPLWIPIHHSDRTLAGGRRPRITDGWTAVVGRDLYRRVRSRKRGGGPPAANLMVAELNPGRRSATLNWLNFCWSTGAVACPFLVAAAAKAHHVPIFLIAVAALSLVIAVLFTFAPQVEPRAVATGSGGTVAVIRRKLWPFLMLAALFLVYVGTENGFGFWVASFAKSLGSLTATVALMTPSFFSAALMLGRMLAPFLLRSFSDIRLAQAGLILSCAGMAGMIFSHQLLGVVAALPLLDSASQPCIPSPSQSCPGTLQEPRRASARLCSCSPTSEADCFPGSSESHPTDSAR